MRRIEDHVRGPPPAVHEEFPRTGQSVSCALPALMIALSYVVVSQDLLSLMPVVVLGCLVYVAFSARGAPEEAHRPNPPQQPVRRMSL